MPIATIVPEVPVACCQRVPFNSLAVRSRAARTSSRSAFNSFGFGGSEVMNCSLSPSAPSLTEKSPPGDESRIREISVEPPPMSMLISEAFGAAHPCAAAIPIRRASSIAERISTETPALRSTSLMN